MKALVLIATLFLSLSANARSPMPMGKYSCGMVNGTDEWVIYIDINKKKAGFFDNDKTVVVKLKSVGTLESLPPQTVYIFEGIDPENRNEGKQRIYFNKTKRTASVTVNVGTRSEETYYPEDDCVLDAGVDLD